MTSTRFVELMIDLKHFMLAKHPGQNFRQDKVFLPISFNTALKFNDALLEVYVLMRDEIHRLREELSSRRKRVSFCPEIIVR